MSSVTLSNIDPLQRQSSIQGTVASPLQTLSRPSRTPSTADQFNLSSVDNVSPLSYPKSKINILVCEKVHELGLAEFYREGFNVIDANKYNQQQLIEAIATAHAVCVRSRTKLTADVLRHGKKLLAVGCFCIGTDQTDLVQATSQGTVVFNSPYANTRSVAELVLCELICLSRQIFDRSYELHHLSKWNKVSNNCFEVRGKVLGIVGYGHVGSQLSVLAESLGMHVLFYDIVPKLSLGNAIPCNTLDELLQKSDFVSLHVPATPETENLMGEKQIQTMKKGSYLLNASRGKVVDVKAASAALHSKHLHGAAFDVYPYEPTGANEAFKSDLQQCPNTILTPHIGGSTEEAQAAIGQEVARKIIAYINTGSTLGAVNLPEMNLPQHKNAHRLLNIHKNVPGVLRDVNNILSEYNVVGQMLMTTGDVGYLIADIDKSASKEVKDRIAHLSSNIKTRILY